MPPRRGRPPKLEDHDKQILAKRFEEYINETDLPIIAEFAAMNGLWKSYFYDNAEFANLIKKAVTKKEAALEKGALTGTYNATMAIFSLKQPAHGWKDKEDKISLNLDDISPEQAKAILDAYMKG